MREMILHIHMRVGKASDAGDEEERRQKMIAVYVRWGITIWTTMMKR